MTMLPDVLTQVGPYPVKWIGCHPDNRFNTRSGLPIEGVVCHIMEGTLAGCDSWFWDPSASASANFGISKSGEIHQYVRLFGEAPYANGVPNEPRYVAEMNPQVLAISRRYWPASQNKWTWSIEHEGFSGEQITGYPAMFDASTRLCALLLASLPPERRRTWGHDQFNGIDRPNCPGWTTATWRGYDERVMQLIDEMEDPMGNVTRAEYDALREELVALRDQMAASQQHFQHWLEADLHPAVFDDLRPRVERLERLAQQVGNLAFRPVLE